MIRLCVLAPTGRMGAQVASVAIADTEVDVVSALGRKGNVGIGQALLTTSVRITDNVDDALAAADVYIDFSTPETSAAVARAAMRHRTSAVVGTTGLDSIATPPLRELAKSTPVLVAANFSPGIALLVHFARLAAAALGDDYDLDVIELHHRNKVDSPSGTALALGGAFAEARGLDIKSSRLPHQHNPVGARLGNDIGFASVRAGDIVGEHTALLTSANERIELTHRAQNRNLFALGALRAAHWLVGRPPGLYSMTDVLGI